MFILFDSLCSSYSLRFKSPSQPIKSNEPMQFKAPKGDIFGWSIFWFIAGLVLAVYGPIRGDIVLTISAVVALSIVALIWLDQKWIAPPVMIMYLLGAVARLLTLVLKGFTLLGTAKLLMPLYFAYLMWEWYRSDDEALLPVSSSEPRTPTSPFDTQPDDDRWSNPYRGNHPDEQ